MTDLSDKNFGFNLCSCGQRKSKADVSCGRCPCRRATDDEVSQAYEQGRELLTCPVCDSSIVPSVRPGYEPRRTDLDRPRCYECFKDRNVKVRCMHPRHPPSRDRYTHKEFCSSYAVLSTNKTTLGRPFKTVCCAHCSVKYKLQLWEDYALEHGEVDSRTGEIKPLAQHTPELRLSVHPIDRFGGMRVCWCPKRGQDGTYIIKDGHYIENVVLFKPIKFDSFQWGSARHKIIVCDRMNYPVNVEPPYRGTVWHPSINRWMETIREETKDFGFNQFGWIYARVTGTKQNTESHTFAISSFERWKLNGGSEEFSEWLQHCESLETNHE